ncbi:hypothetical protein ACGH6Q_11945 [Gilliamella sp. BG2]|uniref:hypothetical protein n=1 Tax=Gilliamella sp. BG2 TaxID=3351509 RepID=UPI003987BB68
MRLIVLEVGVGDYIKIKEIKDENNQSFKVKKWAIEKVERLEAQEFIINDFGLANYQFQINGKQSAFAKLIDSNGNEKTIWSKQINRFLNDNKAEKGDKIIIQDDKFIINKKHIKSINLSQIEI